MGDVRLTLLVRTMSTLNKTFTAKLRRSPSKGGWTYVVMPGSGAVLQNTRTREGEGHRRRSTIPKLFMALGNGTHKLPIKAGLRASIAKDVGDSVTIHLMHESTNSGATAPLPSDA